MNPILNDQPAWSSRVEMAQINIETIHQLFESRSSRDPAHDWSHVLRVYRLAYVIAQAEQVHTEIDLAVVEAAALLHDMADDKERSLADRTITVVELTTILEPMGFTPQQIGEVSNAIATHSFSRGLLATTPEAQILQDADRLDAIGAIGVARCFVVGGVRGRPLDDSLQHFYDKLLRLKEGMNTRTGRQLAEERHRFLEAFLEQFARETTIR